MYRKTHDSASLDSLPDMVFKTIVFAIASSSRASF